MEPASPSLQGSDHVQKLRVLSTTCPGAVWTGPNPEWPEAFKFRNPHFRQTRDITVSFYELLVQFSKRIEHECCILFNPLAVDEPHNLLTCGARMTFLFPKSHNDLFYGLITNTLLRKGIAPCFSHRGPFRQPRRSAVLCRIVGETQACHKPVDIVTDHSAHCLAETRFVPICADLLDNITIAFFRSILRRS